MLKSQILILNKVAKDLLGKASSENSATKAAKLTETALRCFAEARQALAQSQSNSVLTFIEIALACEFQPNYPTFLDFCARNGLEILSEIDFNSFQSQIIPKQPPKQLESAN